MNEYEKPSTEQNTRQTRSSKALHPFQPKSARLMDQVQETLLYYKYARGTRESYTHWIRAFVRFNLPKHPKDLEVSDIEAFLNHLVTNRQVAQSTQQQAMHAILFLYKKVLSVELDRRIGAARSRRAPRIPVVLSADEVARLMSHMSGRNFLMAKLLYASGVRVMELCRLRIKDFDFENQRLNVHAGKGDKDRTTLLPQSLHAELRDTLRQVEALHRSDLAAGHGEAKLPTALARKFRNAGKLWIWQFAFPSRTLSLDPESQVVRRHHVDPSALRKAIKHAARAAKIHKRVSPHTLRHSFATELLRHGTNIRVVQQMMGHQDVTTTEIYTHVLANELNRVVSPLDNLEPPAFPAAG